MSNNTVEIRVRVRNDTRPGFAEARRDAATEGRAAGRAWGEGVESNTVEVHVHHLRRKLGSERILTLRGIGYMIEA